MLSYFHKSMLSYLHVAVLIPLTGSERQSFSYLLKSLTNSLPDDDTQYSVFDYYVDESGEWDVWQTRLPVGGGESGTGAVDLLGNVYVDTTDSVSSVWSLLERWPHFRGWCVQALMELGLEDVSLLERCPHFRGWYVQASMELGPEDVSLLERCPPFSSTGTCGAITRPCPVGQEERTNIRSPWMWQDYHMPALPAGQRSVVCPHLHIEGLLDNIM